MQIVNFSAFSSSRVDLFVKKQNCRNLSLINCTIYTSMSYLIRRVLAKPRLILDEMCRLYGKCASYVRRVLFFLV